MKEFDFTESFLLRFWSKIDMREHDQCWEWTGAKSNGYGAIKHRKKKLDAHRVAFLLQHGSIKPGMIVGHKCDNKSCCNPLHLECITRAKNNIDAIQRIPRHVARGAEVYCSKSTDELVRAIILIRQLTGWGKRKIAAELGISTERVGYIIHADGWRHLKKAEETGNAPATGFPATDFQSARLLVASPPK